MSGIIELLTTFHGRIGRQQWWLGLCLVVIVGLAGTLAIDPQAFTADNATPSWINVLWQLALVVPETAITVKRFNDRDWPWWLGYLVALIALVQILLSNSVARFATQNPIAALSIFLSLFAFLTFALIDNGFIRGTKGPNRYGPDPLTGYAA